LTKFKHKNILISHLWDFPEVITFLLFANKKGADRMKQNFVKIICLAIIVLMSPAFLPQAVADEATVNLESFVVQDFDKPDEQPWFVVGSKFATAGYPKVTYAKTWPQALHGLNPSNKELFSLGVAMLFDRKEYNWIDVIPGKKSGSGNDVSYEPTTIPLPGRVRSIDVWVWSANFNYTVEVFVMDYRGIVHVLPLGDLNYLGWKNLRTNVPTSVPQSKKYIPRFEGLKLVKFRIWTHPAEIVAMPVPVDSPLNEKAVYFYFDNIKVLTDTYEGLFDGDALAGQDSRNDIWASVE
jgi:hypothetical protein